MHQTRRGEQWHFGMKAHIGVDSRTRLIHSVVATPANVHDSRVLPDLLHAEETRGRGDSAYTGQKETMTDCAPRARDITQAKSTRNRKLTDEARAGNRYKSRVRARVEHQSGIIKRHSGFTKVRYHGQEKNAHRLFVACALSKPGDGEENVVERKQSRTAGQLRLKNGDWSKKPSKCGCKSLFRQVFRRVGSRFGR